MFAPDLIAVLDVEQGERLHWVVAEEGKGIDLALEVTLRGSRKKDLEENVERYARTGMTSLVHGKVNHEETLATVSRAGLYPNGHYIVVLDMSEAEEVAQFIEADGDPQALLERFPYPKTSEGFDPQVHLQRIGVANQTTMLSSESLAIARRIVELQGGAIRVTSRTGEGTVFAFSLPLGPAGRDALPAATSAV